MVVSFIRDSDKIDFKINLSSADNFYDPPPTFSPFDDPVGNASADQVWKVAIVVTESTIKIELKVGVQEVGATKIKVGVKIAATKISVVFQKDAQRIANGIYKVQRLESTGRAAIPIKFGSQVGI